MGEGEGGCGVVAFYGSDSIRDGSQKVHRDPTEPRTMKRVAR